MGGAVGDQAAGLGTVGRISTRGAELNSRVRARGDFVRLSRACAELEGIGLVPTHSGTTLGIAFTADDPGLADKIEHLRTACAPLPRTGVRIPKLGGGGAWSAVPHGEEKGRPRLAVTCPTSEMPGGGHRR